ncbi:MAG: hypothetical protein ACYDC1_09930 [Limisphaerales bacterium]
MKPVCSNPLLCLLLAGLHAAALAAPTAPQRQEVELTLTAARDEANPCTDTAASVDFAHEDGTKIRRPLF